MSQYLVFDVGGTYTHLGLTEDLQTIKKIKKIATPSHPNKFTSQIESFISNTSNVEGIAGGVRGILFEDRTGIEKDHILEKWSGVSLHTLLEDIAQVPVFLENDAAVAGLGEAVFGAGKGIEIIAYHDISTGVGGAKIINGSLDASSLTLEPGLQIIDIDRTVLGNDINPTLENLISGSAVAQRMGTPAETIPEDDIIWTELAGYLASGLRNTALYWSPDAIILGGSMMLGTPRIPLDAVRQETVRVLDDIIPCPFITLGTLGDTAGLYGAMVLLQQRM
jgi:predicted NBD/HSP70 family sugar kinase